MTTEHVYFWLLLMGPLLTLAGLAWVTDGGVQRLLARRARRRYLDAGGR